MQQCGNNLQSFIPRPFLSTPPNCTKATSNHKSHRKVLLRRKSDYRILEMLWENAPTKPAFFIPRIYFSFQELDIEFIIKIT